LHIIKDERLVSKIEGKTNFSTHLKQFDGLTWLTLTPVFYDRSTPLPWQLSTSRNLHTVNFQWTVKLTYSRAYSLQDP